MRRFASISGCPEFCRGAKSRFRGSKRQFASPRACLRLACPKGREFSFREALNFARKIRRDYETIEKRRQRNATPFLYLAEHRRRPRKLSADDVAKIVILGGLDALYNVSLIHCDFKESNALFVNGAPELKFAPLRLTSIAAYKYHRAVLLLNDLERYGKIETAPGLQR